MKSRNLLFFPFAALIFILLISGIFIPVIEIRLAVAVAVLILFGFFFMKKSFFFISAFFVSIVIAAVLLLKSEIVQNFLLKKGISVTRTVSRSGNFDSLPTENLKNTTDTKQTIEIIADRALVVFESGKENIMFSTSVHLSEKSDSLFFSTEATENTRPYIKIGNTNKIKNISVNGNGVEIRGSMNTAVDKLELSGTGMSINGDIKSKLLRINGAGMDINGTLETDDTVIHGIGMKIKNRISSKTFTLRGAGMKMESEMEKTSAVTISGIGGEVKIRFIDKWSEERIVRSEGLGTETLIMIPEKNTGTLTSIGDNIKVEAH
ncbi:MAG: hypothetical protein R6W70_09850 [bacterium]